MKRRTFLAVTAFAGLVAYGETGGTSHRTASQAAARPDRASQGIIRKALTYARLQYGKPYVWGGTGPDVFDCSGLVMMAYRSAGINLPRTSQEQWAAGTRVTDPRPGDLVYFAGVDGTPEHPGHVGLVSAPGWMIQAYAPGTPIGSYPFGTSGALQGTGPGDVVGYTRPTA